MRINFWIISCITAIGVSAGIATVQAQHAMRIGLASVNDVQHELANKFAEEINKRTQGQIKAEVFPAAQLGAIPRQVENVKLGAQAAFISPPGFFAGLNRAFEAPDAPGIYKSFWHSHNAFTDPEFRDHYLLLGDKGGVVGAMLYRA